MPKKRPTYEQRIPLAHEGIQINFCKNPECFNFGIPALENIKGLPLPSVAGSCNRNRDNYTIVGEKNLRCHFCGQEPPMKSNKGIYDEFSRMWAYLEQKPPQEFLDGQTHASLLVLVLRIAPAESHTSLIQ